MIFLFSLTPFIIPIIIVIILACTKNDKRKKPPRNYNHQQQYPPIYYGNQFPPINGIPYNVPPQPMSIEQNQLQVDYSKCYQAKYLLTQNEWHEHQKLRKFATEKGLIVCPKVRLLDIIEPRRGDNYMSLLGKIQSKHVDFVICDQGMHIKGILELDDNSHNRKDRQERDAFVDQILTSVGYKVIHTRGVTETTLDAFATPTNTYNNFKQPPC